MNGNMFSPRLVLSGLHNKKCVLKYLCKCIFILVGIYCTNTVGCRDNQSGPEGTQPGKRNYVWTVDTLSYPGSIQTDMYDVWASSAKNIYIVGYNDQNSGQMYHFDGVTWSPIHLDKNHGGNIPGAFALSAIYGFSANDIYAIGEEIYQNRPPPIYYSDSSFIIHFAGTTWEEMPITRRGYLTCIWGAKSNDVWAGGDRGTLYHYTGTVWDIFPFDTNFIFQSISGFSTTDVYATCGKYVDKVAPIDTQQYFLYHYNGYIWAPVDSFTSTPDQPAWKFGLRLWACNKTLYATTYGVYERQGNGWKQLLASYLPLNTYGSSSENIFSVGDAWQIYQWNGTDWKQFPSLITGSGGFTCCWTNDIETFLIGFNGPSTFVMHGK